MRRVTRSHSLNDVRKAAASASGQLQFNFWASLGRQSGGSITASLGRQSGGSLSFLIKQEPPD